MSDLKPVLLPAAIAAEMLALRQSGHTGLVLVNMIGGEVKTIKVPQPDREVRA